AFRRLALCCRGPVARDRGNRDRQPGRALHFGDRRRGASRPRGHDLQLSPGLTDGHLPAFRIKSPQGDFFLRADWNWQPSSTMWTDSAMRRPTRRLHLCHRRGKSPGPTWQGDSPVRTIADGHAVVSIQNLGKTYDTGYEALKDVTLDIRRGEIFALLGPNGAGKTTLIGTVCGLVQPTSGRILVGGFDVVTELRGARCWMGLVPQELTTDRFETVWNTVSFTRGLFGKPRNDAHIEKTLRDLSLWDKRNDKLITLSGGMKRRVLIAKALSHEPEILFLDEPTAGVDVELRKGMWDLVQKLREQGVTVILTTHYI